jgi:hypothetical protein
MLKWVKKFFRNLPFVKKLPCKASVIIDGKIYFCFLNDNHIGAHKTYLGDASWPWHWKPDGK